MLALNKDGTIRYTDISILPYYVDDIEFCVIDIGNKLKGPMCVLDTPRHLLSIQKKGDLKMKVSVLFKDGDNCPVDEMDYGFYYFHSNNIQEWYSILPMIDQFILLNEFYEQNLSYNPGINVGTISITPYNKPTVNYPISFDLDNYCGYQEFMTKENRELFGNRNRDIFHCRSINSPKLCDRFPDFITISKGRWKRDWYDTGSKTRPSLKGACNITRTCKRFVNEEVEFVILAVSPSISFILTLDELIRYENISKVSMCMIDEYPDIGETNNNINITGDKAKILQVGMTINNYLSLMTNYVFTPTERYYFPSFYLEISGVDTLYKGRERKNLSISLSQDFVNENMIPLFYLINAMIEEGYDWR